MAEHRDWIPSAWRRAGRHGLDGDAGGLGHLLHLGRGYCGRNSCSGGSSSRIVTGRPRMMRNSSTKSSRCMGRILASAARRPSMVSATIISRMATMRPPSKNICSVRQSPMPSAPKRRAMRASSGVSALARTFIRRVLVGPDHELGEIAGELGLDGRHLAQHHLAGAAVDGEEIAVVHHDIAHLHDALPARRCAGPRRRRRKAVPCRGRPRRHGWSCRRGSVSMPAAACMPWISSGLVSVRTRMTFSPLAARSSASSAVKTARPAGRPRRGRQAAGDHLARRLGIEGRMQQLVERGGIDARDRLALVDQPFAHHVDGDLERRLRPCACRERVCSI